MAGALPTRCCLTLWTKDETWGLGFNAQLGHYMAQWSRHGRYLGPPCMGPAYACVRNVLQNGMPTYNIIFESAKDRFHLIRFPPHTLDNQAKWDPPCRMDGWMDDIWKGSDLFFLYSCPIANHGYCNYVLTTYMHLSIYLLATKCLS
jgi:hypothetical protein